jgi:tetratricopeptide (TPR) repeat protein
LSYFVETAKGWKIGIAVAVLLAGAALTIAYKHSQPPLALLAVAYSSRRTMDLRIPGAAYSALRTPRGSIAFADAPPALLESQLQIARHLASKPEAPVWLHAQGRAQLLLWQFDAALASFEAAADLGASSPDFLIDYASAYYQRAERNSSALDYARALEKLGQALHDSPDNPTALFNRAIVSSRLHQYSSAIDDFERYLRLPADSAWKNEAEQRLREVRILISRLDPHRPTAREFQAEQDLEEAMISGLEAYFHGKPSNLPQSAAAMLSEHRDPWLTQVIGLAPTPENVRAVETLGQLAALRVNLSPDYNRRAADLKFLSSRTIPVPLQVWRDFELLYRDTRTPAVATCAKRAALLIPQAALYPWFESQLLLESSLCSAGEGDFAQANLQIDGAEQIVRATNLVQASIRIPNYRGQRLVDTGYFREALQLASEGLSQFNRGSYPARRAYDFYAIFMLSAVQLNLPNTGYGASRMMAEIGEKNGLPLFAMLGRCRQAGFALQLGLRADAATALGSATARLGQLGDVDTARTYWRTSRIAWLEAEGDLPSLYRMLNEARQNPEKNESLYFDRNLIVALCRLESRLGHRAPVEEMADRFWKDAAGIYASRPPGALRAFRSELESVSQSLATVRLRDGDPNGGLRAWQRFLDFDQRLLGAREIPPASNSTSEAPAILTIADLGGQGGIWLESGGQIAFHWSQQPYPELAREVRKVRRLCSLGASTRDVSAEARTLYRILFPAGIGRASHVIVRTRGPLNTLPLEIFSLFDEGRNAVFSFLPFGEQTGALTANPLNAKRMTVIAATSIDPHHALPRLPDMEIQQEISAVSRAFPNTTVIQGAQATPRVMEGAAATSEALHFAGHAMPWHGNIGLLVSPDAGDASAEGRGGVWSMGRPRSVNAALVVLSACSTAAFEDPVTVESGQLALSMLLAGGRQVVASLWDVDSSAATAWNRAFYDYLGQGRGAAESVHLASAQLRSTNEWRSPRQWAGFALYEQ